MRRHYWELPPARNRRLDPALYQIPDQPCFFTLRCTRDLAPFTDDRLAQISVTCLLEQRHKSLCQIEAYCLMPDHLHVVVTPSVESASSLRFIERFKGWAATELRHAGWAERVWQPRSYDHVVRAEDDLRQIVEYILANPVRKGLVERIEDYRWSGIPEPIEVNREMGKGN